MAERTIITNPFLRKGTDTRGMMLGMMICLTLTAVHFALRYDPAFLTRYASLLLAAWGIELSYVLLKDNRFEWPHLSTAVTAALLVLSVPAYMPWMHVFYGLIVAVLFGKLMVDRKALRLNPMLLGRLFLMIFFASSIQNWLNPDIEIDALSSATPLGLYYAEDITYAPLQILTGSIRGDWEGIYAIIPGSPGEVMPLLSLACGIVLYLTGIQDWRAGAAFLIGFALTCPLLGLPVGFHLVSGSLIFSAVYILSDPRSMPGSKAGRLMAGFIAGILNALIRNHGFYPEGVAIAVLTVNLLSPTLDRIAFTLRGWRLAQRTS
jgi:electron transport complex protein RnfD